MRTKKIFDAVNASTQQISDEIEIDPNFRQSLQIVKTGTDVDPELFIEISNGDGAGGSGPWNVIQDQGPPVRDFFLLDDSPIFFPDVILDGTFKFMRLRMEANGTTTGTVTIVQAIKEQS